MVGPMPSVRKVAVGWNLLRRRLDRVEIETALGLEFAASPPNTTSIGCAVAVETGYTQPG